MGSIRKLGVPIAITMVQSVIATSLCSRACFQSPRKNGTYRLGGYLRLRGNGTAIKWPESIVIISLNILLLIGGTSKLKIRIQIIEVYFQKALVWHTRQTGFNLSLRNGKGTTHPRMLPTHHHPHHRRVYPKHSPPQGRRPNAPYP